MNPVECLIDKHITELLVAVETVAYKTRIFRLKKHKPMPETTINYKVNKYISFGFYIFVMRRCSMKS